MNLDFSNILSGDCLWQEDLTCLGLEECPSWAILWVLLMGSVPVTDNLTLIFPLGEKFGPLNSKGTYCACHSLQGSGFRENEIHIIFL